MYYQCFLLCIAGLPIAPKSATFQKKTYSQFAYRAASNFLAFKGCQSMPKRWSKLLYILFSERQFRCGSWLCSWTVLFFYFINASFLGWGRVVILLLLPFLNQPTLVAACLLSLMIVWAHKCLSFKWYSRLLSSVSARIIGVVINIHRFY